MKKVLLGLATAAALAGYSPAPAAACDPSLPTCDPQGTVDEVVGLVGHLTWPLVSRLDDLLGPIWP